MLLSMCAAVALTTCQPRLTERPLADVAVISLPRSIKDESFTGIRGDQPGRLTFTFSTSYFWASFGSGTAYKHQLVVSLMAPNATDADYAEYPPHFRLLYDNRKVVRHSAIGAATLSVTAGVYRQNSLQEPSYTFVYADRLRRLQIAWHVVKSEVDLATGIELVHRMAASFRVLRDPTSEFAEQRGLPAKDADDRARKRALARATLQREGFGHAEPGKPVFAHDAYVEWMNDPEPRMQLLAVLGRVRVAPNASPAGRPRPVSMGSVSGATGAFAGVVGWREFTGESWELSNRENAYLPFPGVSETLAATGRDPAFVTFYYAATVRVEESTDDRLTTLRWFFDQLPDVRRLWREGTLVTGGAPERE